jgi:hypothetical protein
MPQSSREPIGRRQVLDAVPAASRTAVVSNPVHTAVGAAPGSQTGALAAALTGIQPGLTKYLMSAQDDKNQQDAAAGSAERVTVGNVDSPEALSKLTPNQSASFQLGYLKMHASLSASKKAREMESDFATGFNPDTDNIDDFLSKHMHPSDYQGMDKSYLETYLPAVQNVAEQIRAKYQATVTDNVLQKRNGMLFEGFTNIAEVNAKGMAEPSPEDIQSMYDLGTQMGVSKKDIELQMFSAFKTASTRGNGNSRLLDYFFKPRADGSPGLAYTAKYGEHVVDAKNAAETHSYTEYTRGKALEANQRKEVSGNIFKQLADLHFSGKNITALVHQWKDYLEPDDFKFLRTAAAEGFQPEDLDEVSHTDYLIRTGDIDLAGLKILANEGKIGKSFPRLASLADEMQTRGTAIQKSHETQSARNWLSGSFPVGGALDFDKAAAANRDAALREFDIAMSTAQSDSEAEAHAERILRRFGITPGKPAAVRRPLAETYLPNGSVDEWERETVWRFKATLIDPNTFNEEMAGLKRIRDGQLAAAKPKPK